MSDILAQLHAEHKARHLRFKAVARIGENAQRALPAPVAVIPPKPRRARGRHSRRELSFIIELVADRYGFPVEAIAGPSRVTPVVRARQIGIFLAKVMTRASVVEIGRAFHRDHTTALSAIFRVEKRMAAPEFAAEIEEIKVIIADAADRHTAPTITSLGAVPVKPNDRFDKRYGLLVVLPETPIPALRANRGTELWRCRCDCGCLKTVTTSYLSQKEPPPSCGCIGREKARAELAARRAAGVAFGCERPFQKKTCVGV